MRTSGDAFRAVAIKVLAWLGMLFLSALAFFMIYAACGAFTMSGYFVVHGLKIARAEVSEMHRSEADFIITAAVVCAIIAIAATVFAGVIAAKNIHPWLIAFPVTMLLGGLVFGWTQIQTLYCPMYFGVEACI